MAQARALRSDARVSTGQRNTRAPLFVLHCDATRKPQEFFRGREVQSYASSHLQNRQQSQIAEVSHVRTAQRGAQREICDRRTSMAYLRREDEGMYWIIRQLKAERRAAKQAMRALIDTTMNFLEEFTERMEHLLQSRTTNNAEYSSPAYLPTSYLPTPSDAQRTSQRRQQQERRHPQPAEGEKKEQQVAVKNGNGNEVALLRPALSEEKQKRTFADLKRWFPDFYSEELQRREGPTPMEIDLVKLRNLRAAAAQLVFGSFTE